MRGLDRVFRFRTLVQAVKSIFNPKSLFATGAPGLWYDLSLTDGTLFQDAAGTLPVTAVEQPVGLVLDKSKGLVLGSELVSNTSPSFRVLRDGVQNLIYTGPTLASGKYYVISVTVTANAGTIQASLRVGGSGLNFIGGYLPAIPAGQNKTFTYNASPTVGGTLTINGDATGTDLVISNISVREIPGNHAFQSTSANRPVVSARYNLLTKTEQFDDAAWVKGAGITITPNNDIAPDGKLTADKVDVNGALSTTLYELATVTANTTYVFSFYVKLGTMLAADFKFAIYDATNGSYHASNIVPNVTPVTTNYVRVDYSFTTPAGCTSVRVYPYSNGALPSGSLYLWGADLREANDGVGLPPYQRVNTATDYDTVGFPLYLRFNGSTQWMQTNSIDFSSTDKVLVAAGVRKLSDSTAATVAELSANSGVTPNTFAVFAPGAVAPNYAFRSSGTSDSVAAATTFASPITNVLVGLGEVASDTAILRINGTQAASSTADQGTGNLGQHPLYIGARAGTSLFFNGRLYSLIIAGIKPTDAQILGVETYINRLTRAF